MLVGEQREALKSIVEECERLSRMGPIFELSLDEWLEIALVLKGAVEHPRISRRQARRVKRAARELIASVREWSPELAGRLEYWLNSDEG